MPIIFMLKKQIIKWLLPRLLAKKCPKTISSIGLNANRFNCFYVYLGSETRRRIYVVDGFDTKKNELKTFTLDKVKNTFSIKKTITLEKACNYNLEVAHRYKSYEINHTNIYKLAFYHITKFYKLSIFRREKNQSRFNKKNLIIKDSAKLLRFMLERQLSKVPNFRDHLTDSGISLSFADLEVKGVDIYTLMDELQTERWLEHPDSDKEKTRLKMHLESLILSGDLETKTDGIEKYIVQAQALRTLEQYEDSDRRHKEVVFLQKIIAIFTGIIALVALVQFILIIIDWLANS